MLGLLLFVVAPVVDLYLLYRIGQAWGPLPAVGLVVGTAALGMAIARAQGLRMLRSAGRDMAAGRAPGREAMTGLATLGAAFLLIAPGPLTDGLGLLLLFPPTRWLLLAAGRRSVERMAASGALRVSVLRWQPGAPPGEEPDAGEAPLGLDPSKEIRLPPPGGDA